jgi:16S rRNA (guanine527-N7)-methyltransferase
MSTDDFVPALDRIVAEIDSTPSGLNSRQLRLYLEELFRWNPQVGLVSKQNSEATVLRLIRLSFHLWEYTAQFLDWGGRQDIIRFMDIGSGGGFPGLIWKMVNPALEGCLVDRKDKKIQFLERVIRKTEFSGLEAIAADIQDLSQEPVHRNVYDVVTMLAVKPPPVLASVIEAFLRPGGYFSTVRSSNQKIIEDHLGEGLILQDALVTDEGVFVLYRKED